MKNRAIRRGGKGPDPDCSLPSSTSITHRSDEAQQPGLHEAAETTLSVTQGRVDERIKGMQERAGELVDECTERLPDLTGNQIFDDVSMI